MPYITESALRSTPANLLVQGFVKDRSNAERYREEILRKLVDDPLMQAIWNGTLLQPVNRSQPVSSQPIYQPSPTSPQPVISPDIRPKWQEVFQSFEPISSLATVLLTSGWNFIDPRGLMKMPPEAVEDFLRSLEWQPYEYYNMLSSERQKTLYMMIDVYGRWYRQQKAQK